LGKNLNNPYKKLQNECLDKSELKGLNKMFEMMLNLRQQGNLRQRFNSEKKDGD
jgi:hypothetical protein